MLHWPLSKIRQPRVIAEVIGGILLGPSVMGRIPGFTDTIFPKAAMPNLSLVANLGLVLFLFLVGLEVDLRFLTSNWRSAMSVAFLGMALPFGLGCAVATGLYHQFSGEEGQVPVAFGTYLLFIGVAMAITAFPVLCRILTELKLLSTNVGVIVLAAGVSNDVVGWILLALCVALVNAGSGITALYILLVSVGYILFLVYAVRPGFMYILRRTRSLEDGPSQSIVALTLLMALVSAFFTGIIGIHPIFGAFIAGLICPHDGGFAIKVTEKIEDLVSALLLPLYFALSGLSTNLSLLDSGITWGYVFAVTIVAFVAKFIGGSLAAKFNGMVWRESMTVGVLMSCKGLVELIVLNIGLNAKILSTRVFTIFVVMALVTTFSTTPLTAALYPPWYQKKLAAWRRGEIDWATGKPTGRTSEESHDAVAVEKDGSTRTASLLVYLRLDSMPSLVAFISMFGAKTAETVKKHPQSGEKSAVEHSENPFQRPVEVHGVRLLGLTDRGSTVMKVTETDEYTSHDPVINTFRTFGRLHNLAVSGEVAFGPEDGFAELLTNKASVEDSDLLLLPWTETGVMSEAAMISNDSSNAKLQSSAYAQFIFHALNNASTTTAVFIDKGGFGGNTKAPTRGLKRSVSGLSLRSAHRDTALTVPSGGSHIFMPFFGGADGRTALRLVLQLAENSLVTATIVCFEGSGAHQNKEFSTNESGAQAAATAISGGLQEHDRTFFLSLQKSLSNTLTSRVRMTTSASADTDALRAAVAQASSEVTKGTDLIIVGRSKTSANDETLSSEASRCLGACADAFMADDKIKASLVVVQAKKF